MPPRLFVNTALAAPGRLTLPEDATRHAQVLRLQPGSALTLFNGQGGEWSASVESMGRREVCVQVLSHHAIERELTAEVTLALAMPAGERMDFVIEKATELGAAGIQPLISERSVLRLSGERAQKRREHWQAMAVAACEQCGRNRVPVVHAVSTLAAWLAALPPATEHTARRLLAWRDAQPWQGRVPDEAQACVFLSGPEGGLSEAEEALARAAGFAPVSLGPRVLRADTAPLAALASVALNGAR